MPTALQPSFSPAFVRDVTVNPASVAAASVLVVSVPVAGALKENHIVVEAEALEAGLSLGDAWCDTNGTVKVRLINPTAAPVDPASQTWTIMGF